MNRIERYGLRRCRRACIVIAVAFGIGRGLCATAIATEITVSGITEPIKDETLSSTVPGVIELIHFREGHRVQKDDILIELKKKLEELEVARRKLVWESKAELNSAEEKVKTLKMDVEGTRNLYRTTQSVSKDELNKKELEYTIAVAEYERLKTVEGREEIEYEMALEQLDARRIKSPINGIVTEILLEEGENCDENQPLIRVVDISRFYFICHIASAYAPFLSHGEVVPIEIENGPTVNGEIEFISPVVDPASGLQKIKVVVDNEDDKVRPGVAGSLKLTVDEKAATRQSQSTIRK